MIKSSINLRPKQIIFRMIREPKMPLIDKKLLLPILRFLDYHRLIDINLLYSEDFFKSNLDLSWLRDVEFVSKIIYETFKPKSVIDVGCGVGAYLYYLSNFGVDVRGIEGSDAAFKALMVPKDKVEKIDLRLISFYKVKKKYDLALCFEVLEHLNPKHADDVLDFLCKVSDTILISAAYPGQGGIYHINEQPPKYWISKMRIRRYELDLFVTNKIRKEIAEKVKVTTWISKNLLVFHRI